MKKLYRSDRQKVFAGVCGGLSEYLNVDVSIIRLIWLLTILLAGSGLLAYIVAALIIPRNPDPFGIGHDSETIGTDKDGETIAVSHKGRNNTVILIGLVLILLGALALADAIVPGLIKKFFLPGLLILTGLIIIVSSFKER